MAEKELRIEIDLVEHGRRRESRKGLTVSRMLHLGTKKGCPLCKEVQEKNLSQIREYRFSIKRGELFRIIATCFAYQDDQSPLWDTASQCSELFDVVYPLTETQDKVFHEFMEMARSEFGGDRATVRGGTEAELEQFEKNYLRKQKEDSEDKRK